MSHGLREAAAALERAGRPLTMVSLAHALGISRATLYRQAGGAEGVGALLKQDVGTRWRDDELFAAVHEVLAARGLRGTTLEAVSDACGVSVVTLQRRFGDRPGLLRTFVDALPARQAGRRLASADVHDVRRVLVRFLTLALEELERFAPLTRALLADPAAAKELGLARDPARGVSAGLVAYLSRCAAAGTLRSDAPERATFLLSALFGFVLLRGTVPGSKTQRPDAVATLLVNGFLDGAAVSGRRRP